MKRIIILTAAGMLLASPSFAQTTAELDMDGDGLVSFGELMAVYADIAEEQFGALDTDLDGYLSGEELAAATEAGTLPATSE